MEAKYIACSSMIQEAAWLRRFLQNIEVVKTAFELVTLYCDNMAALAYTKDSKYHGKTKHIHIRYHFIREMITQNEVILKHIPANEMVAIELYKPLVILL